MTRNDNTDSHSDGPAAAQPVNDLEADTTEAGPGTALATIPWPSTLGRHAQPAAGALTALLARGQAAVGELQFASRRPPSLREQLAYAATGEWTEDIGGARRHLMRAYVLAVATPLTTAAYLVAWAVARPTRLMTATAVTTLLCTALNTIPGLRWLVPDWTTLPYWPPLSWIF